MIEHKQEEEGLAAGTRTGSGPKKNESAGLDPIPLS